MRITYITPSHIPSTEANTIQVTRMCEAFAKEGNQVQLLSPNKKSDPDATISDFYDIDPIFKFRQLPWHPFKGYQFAPLAAAAAKQFQSDVVFSRSIAGCYFSMYFDIDIAYESHVPADNIHPITNRMFNSMITSDRLSSLVVISNSLREYYESKYDISDKLCVAHDAAPPWDGVPIESIQNRGGQQIGYVGHLYQGKGVEIIHRVARAMPNTTFHIVGGKDQDLQYWRSRTEDLSNMVFHGFVQPRKVPNYLASFDVALAPYQQNVYGASCSADLSQWMSPLKIFEYMSARLPIICSDIPVLQEILTDGKNAVLCPPDDVEAWTAAIQSLQVDKGLKKRIGTNAYQDFLDNYTYSSRAKKILEMLTETVANEENR